MDAIRNLPAPLRIGLPVGIVLIVALALYMTMFKAAPPVEILKTQDVSEYNTSMSLLDLNNITYTESSKGDEFILEVADGDANDAAKVLASSGIRDRTGLAPKITCQAAPGFTATKAANERSENCDDAEKVQRMLLAAGAIAANVSEAQQESEDFGSVEPEKTVVAQVFMPEKMREEWDAADAAAIIAGTVGTARERVVLADDRMKTLFDGADGSSSSEDTATAGGGSCNDVASATEIETKKEAVRSCYESRIGAKLTSILGSKDRYVLAVEPTIQSQSSTTNVTKLTPGPAQDVSAQKGDGSSISDVSKPANETNTTVVTPAGAVTQLRISVTVDSNFASKEKLLAVKRILSSYAGADGRKDPAPTVTTAPLSSPSDSTKDELKKIKEKAKANDTSAANTPLRTQKTVMPTWAKIAMVLLVIGTFTAILVLWRRSAAMAAERARLEESFRNEQRLFEDFANQNPDTLAQELNQLFGAPAAPERAY
jgi:hypothetical protein